MLDDGRCGEGTTLDEDTGECVPAETTCESGTTYDHTRRTCVSDADLLCGDGVVVDPDSGKCVPGEELCEQGTVFDADTRRCVPGPCRQGEVRVDGICLDEARQLAENADLEERENNDPDNGGLAERLYLNMVDEAPAVFTGTIGEPEDLDGDGFLDQDADVYEFVAVEGSWLEVAVQSIGMPAPGFKIEGPEGFVRYSPVGGGAHAAREIVIPRDGTYKLTVLPEIVLQTDGAINLLGGDDWDYVGSVRRVSFPAATPIDVSGSASRVEGDVLSLSDNLYELDGAEADDLFRLIAEEVGEDAEILVQVWEDGTSLQRSFSFDPSRPSWVSAPDGVKLQILVDWVRVEGGRANYDFSLELSGKGRKVAIPAGGSQALRVPATSRDTISASVQHLSDGSYFRSLDVRIHDAAGTVLASEQRLRGDQRLNATVWADETYTVTFDNRSYEDVEVLLMASVTSPLDLGQLANGVMSESTSRAIASGEVVAYKFDVSAERFVEIAHFNDDRRWASVEVFDGNGQAILQESALSPVESSYGRGRSPFWYTEQAGEILVVLHFANGVDGHRFAARSVAPTVLGTLTPQGTLTASESTTVEYGFSEFIYVNVDEPLAVSSTFTNGQQDTMVCTIYDADSEQVTYNTGHGGECQVGATLDTTGRYMARLTASGAQFNQYDARLVGMPLSEDLGTLPADSTHTSTILEHFHNTQTYAATFTAQSGQLLEITHDNDHNTSVRLRLLDENGVELLSEPDFDTSTVSYRADYVYWYVDQQASFTVEIQGDYRASINEVLTVDSQTIHDFGALSLGQTDSYASSGPLERGQSAFHRVSLTSPSWIEVQAQGASDTTDVDLSVYDTQMNLQYSVNSYSEGIDLSKRLLDSGDYLVVVEAEEATASYDASLTKANAPTYVSSPAAIIPSNSQVSDSVNVSGCASVNTAEVYVDLSHPSIRYLNVSLRAPSGVTVALHSQTGSFYQDSLVGWYPLDLTPDQSLTALTGTVGDGAWTLTVQNSRYNTGVLENWALELSCN